MKAVKISLLGVTFMASVTAGLSQQNSKQYLDSVIIPKSYKDVFSYDSRENNTLYENYSWQNNTWVVHSKRRYEYTYNDKGNMAEHISYDWLNNTWIRYTKELYAMRGQRYRQFTDFC